MKVDWLSIRCVVFDFGFTLSSDLYFTEIPPNYPLWRDVIQSVIFADSALVNAWMAGELTLADIAALLTRHFDLPLPVIVETMERGCTHMKFNPAVWELACAQRAQGRKTALVTDNMDVFTQVVVPAHGLQDVFDVIVNSADYHEIRKDVLWHLAFDLLGEGIGYSNSLLIEDGAQEPALFRANGGCAYQYQNDELLREWLANG